MTFPLKSLPVFIVLCLFTGSACSDSPQQNDMVSLRFQAPGMHCQGCVQTAESTIRKLPGVDSVQADLVMKEILVVVDTTQARETEIAAVIARLGFSESEATEVQ